MKLHGLLEDCGVLGHGCIWGSGKWRVEKKKTSSFNKKDTEFTFENAE